MRLLFKVANVPPRRIRIDLREDWRIDPMPGLGMVGVEGNPAAGALWSPAELLDRAAEVREFVHDSLEVTADHGVSRLDVTTSRRFETAQGRAFLQGMAALELPRLEGNRRPNVGQPRSIAWTGARTAAIKCRVYCESFKIAGREVGQQVRLEDQRRFNGGRQLPLDVAADPEHQRRLFMRRFEPMRKAVDGVKAMTLPVMEQALADEFRFGYRGLRETERLVTAAVLLRAGAADGYSRATRYKRRAELRRAGYVVVDDLVEPVEVNLGDELEAALSDF